MLPMDALWYTAPWTIQCLRAGTAGKETRQLAAAGVGVGDPPPPLEGGGGEQGGKEVAPVNQNSPQSIAPGPLSARMSWREESSLPRCCAPGVCLPGHPPDGYPTGYVPLPTVALPRPSIHSSARGP